MGVRDDRAMYMRSFRNRFGSAANALSKLTLAEMMKLEEGVAAHWKDARRKLLNDVRNGLIRISDELPSSSD